MAEMMELIRTLIKDKGQASGPGPQNEIAQPDQRREEPVYPAGFTPPYAPNVHTAQAPLMQQARGFPYGYAPPPTRVNEVGQNLGENTADPITILDLDDPKEQEKIRKESSEQSENNEAQRKLELIEERLKAMQGSDVYGMVDAYKMSLVPDLVLPPKFKAPTFDKYDGTKRLSARLYMYCRKMTGYTSNEKLLIHYFQDSLSGSVTRWYNFLSRDQIKLWTDLAKAFLVQYKHMTDTAPDRMSLQNMEKKTNETFHEYAHKWRDLAAQVQPPMTDKELNKMFLNSLKATYYDRMIGNSNKNFSDVVSAREMIEAGIKQGKI